MNTASLLSDEDILPSPIFIDFLAHWLDQSDFSGEIWADQVSEVLSNHGVLMRDAARARFARLMLDETAQLAFEHVYRWFKELALARSQALADFHERYKFISIVGLARTGGSYLTGELFSALGYDPSAIPAAIAHDGFPDADPFSLAAGRNQWVGSLLSISEYLTMIEMFFSSASKGARCTIPKKLTKAVYAGGLFNSVLGEAAEYVITVRHPIASCISTYDKSGGFPSDGKYKKRSNIEIWIKRDLLLAGSTEPELDQMSYFSAYLRYWQQYYINLAMSGLTANRVRKIIAYGKDTMQSTANAWHKRFGSTSVASEFVSMGSLIDRRPDWIESSEEAMHRVRAVWQLVGMQFPMEELQQCF